MAATSATAAGRSPDEEDLRATDELAAALLARAKGIRVGVACDAAEREDVYRLRYRAVVDRGWGRPENFPDGLERDEYDEGAVLVTAHSGDELVGTTRLVFPSADRLLPTEDAFGVRVEPQGKQVDWGRTVVAHTVAGHRVLLAMFGRAWQEMRARGFHRWVSALSDPILALYRRLGLDFIVLAPPRPFMGVVRSPVVFDVVASTRGMNRLLGSRTAPR